MNVISQRFDAFREFFGVCDQITIAITYVFD